MGKPPALWLCPTYKGRTVSFVLVLERLAAEAGARWPQSAPARQSERAFLHVQTAVAISASLRSEYRYERKAGTEGKDMDRTCVSQNTLKFRAPKNSISRPRNIQQRFIQPATLREDFLSTPWLYICIQHSDNVRILPTGQISIAFPPGSKNIQCTCLCRVFNPQALPPSISFPLSPACPASSLLSPSTSQPPFRQSADASARRFKVIVAAFDSIEKDEYYLGHGRTEGLPGVGRDHRGGAGHNGDLQAQTGPEQLDGLGQGTEEDAQETQEEAEK